MNLNCRSGSTTALPMDCCEIGNKQTSALSPMDECSGDEEDSVLDNDDDDSGDWTSCASPSSSGSLHKMAATRPAKVPKLSWEKCLCCIKSRGSR